MNRLSVRFIPFYGVTPNGAGRIEMAELRKKFELLQNEYLERAGAQDRVSCGRASEMDLPKKYVALPFKKYQVMRREGRVEEYKEVSGYEEFVKWKSRKELEIEDLAGEIENLKREESLELEADQEYCYDPVQEILDRDIEAWEEQKEKELEQRREGYDREDGSQRIKESQDLQSKNSGAVRNGDSRYQESAAEPGFSSRVEKEHELGYSGKYREFEIDSQRPEGEIYSTRGGDSWEGIKERYRDLSGFIERDVDEIREEFERIGRGHEHVCRKLDEQIQGFERVWERELNKVRGGFDRKLEQIDQRVILHKGIKLTIRF